MSMTIEQLIKLYILQKNHHKEPDNQDAKQQFENEYHQLMEHVDLEKNSHVAPPLYANQPEIPFVLFKPKSATVDNKKPLIIHTHGGPKVHVNTQLFHAELAYFLSQGYVVACPNYRGSTDCPTISEWVVRAENKHRVYGPEDVYTVAKHMYDMPYIDKNTVFLRGGSFGSYINAHLLLDIARGKFVNIFAGVHLSGGVKYPVPAALPTTTPLLITHGAKDEIAPFADARIFMEKMVLQRLSEQFNAQENNRNLTTYVAANGDHHLIAPTLQVTDTHSDDYQQLSGYLHLSVNFINNIIQKLPAPGCDYKQQLLQLTQFDSQEVLDKQVIAYKDIVIENRIPPQNILAPEVQKSTSSLKRFTSSPTQAMLKLYLGDLYTGNIEKDMKYYLEVCFLPVEWSDENKTLLEFAGSKMLEDAVFMQQINETITREGEVLTDHPDYMVMYHAADNRALQLYSFINLWQAILKGLPTPKSEDIKEMRLYDFMKNSIEDISVFLKKMRRQKTQNSTFNNVPGFAERALACNPTLISNSHSTASCSLWWYYKAEPLDRVPVGSVIKSLLEMLGIYAPERLNRYTQLFENHRQLLGDSKQALLQQFFVPYTLANKAAYMCQIWGEEFADTTCSLDKPTFMSGLTLDPIAFEKTLHEQKQAFENHGDCPGFGETDGLFTYASILQMRYLVRNDPSVFSYSYLRNPEAHKRFFEELSLLIREDYADYLSYGTPISDSVIDGSSRALGWYANQDAQHAFFKVAKKPNIPALFKQQSELYTGSVQEPRKQFYGDIITEDKATKVTIQERLRSEIKQKCGDRMFLYSLCLYLKGYTYFDLLKEAMETYKNNREMQPKIFPKADDILKKDCEFFLKFIERFSTPAAIDEEELDPGSYHRAKNLANLYCDSLKLDTQKHDFLQPKDSTYYTEYLWGHELMNAKQIVMYIAYIAKEKAYGNDVSRQKMDLY